MTAYTVITSSGRAEDWRPTEWESAAARESWRAARESWRAVLERERVAAVRSACAEVLAGLEGLPAARAGRPVTAVALVLGCGSRVRARGAAWWDSSLAGRAPSHPSRRESGATQERYMAAKIPVQVHIGVFKADVPTTRVYKETRVTITETGNGTIHSASINVGDEPIADAVGNLAFVTHFPAVQSGVPLHVDVRCLDPDEVLIGTPATHEVTLDEVPDVPVQTYYAPQSIFVTQG